MKTSLRAVLLGLILAVAPVVSQAAPLLQTTDFIDDLTRTHFNGFEGIPTDGTFYTGGSGPYVEDGISVKQVDGDPGNDIWVTYSGGRFQGIYSWYPNGGDEGYTVITMADGSDFDNIGFYAGTGDGPNLILFDLLLNGASVLSGSTQAPSAGAFQYIGFSGGGFDELRVRDSSPFGSWNALSLDAIETSSPAAPVPEPGTVMLLGAGCFGLAIYGKRRKNA